LKTVVFRTIHDVPKKVWNGLVAGASCTFSHELWEVVESAQLENFSYRYVLFYPDGPGSENAAPVALASFYSVTTDIAIFAPAWLRGVLTSIRRVAPGFLKLRMLECGTPVSLNSPPFPLGAGVSVRELIEALDALLQKTGRAEGQALIVIRDFEPQAQHLRPELERLGYYWGDSLPNTYLDIVWATPDDYMASMKSYYRSKLQRHLRRNAALGMRYELREQFDDLADTLCHQWMVVHNQADEFSREVLTPAFYRELSQKMSGRAKVLLFFRQHELIGHALLLMDGDVLRWLYFGRNEATNDSLYIFVGHKVIETAILLGARRLEMGLTTYSIKHDLGARSVPIKMALRTVIGATNGLVSRIYPLVNSVPPPHDKSIFKADATPLKCAAAKIRGIHTGRQQTPSEELLRSGGDER
jgi:hypothetical protein